MAAATRPLEGVRVVDLTAIWAGPYAAMLLADYGAEVLKIESPSAWDNVRTLFPPPATPGEHWWNNGDYYNEYNRNKKSVTLDLSKARGRELLGRLIAQSDLLIENYRRDVMDKLGLTQAWLQEQREDLVVVNMSGFGKTGPEADAMGYGPIIEQMSGLVSMGGYGDDGIPMKTGISYGDPIGGIGAAAAAVSGLIRRRRTGKGQFIDLSQREVMSTMIGEAFMGWAMNQRLPSQMGNGHDWMAPHNAYPCAGEDEWVAITVRDDAEWDGLRAAMDDPAWASDGAYADQMARWEHRAALDDQLVGWTQAHTKHEVFERCRAHRVPAAPVQKMLEVIHDPHLEAREFYEPVHNDEVGTWNLHGWPWRWSDCGVCVRVAAPRFGANTVEILGGLLGLSDEELSALEADGVTGSAPIGVAVASEL